MAWPYLTRRKNVANHTVVGFENLSQSPAVPMPMGLMADAVIRVPYGSQRWSPSIIAARIAELIAGEITPTKATVYVVAELNDQEQLTLDAGCQTYRDLGLMADIVTQTERAMAVKLEEHRGQNGNDADHAVINVVYFLPLPEGWYLGNSYSFGSSGVLATVMHLYRSTDIIDTSPYPVLGDFENISVPVEQSAE